MKCAVLRCSNDAVEGTEFCSICKPSGLIVPMKRTEEQNAEEAKVIREEVSKALQALADQMNKAKAMGFSIAFDLQLDRVTGRYQVQSLFVARYY